MVKIPVTLNLFSSSQYSNCLLSWVHITDGSGAHKDANDWVGYTWSPSYANQSPRRADGLKDHWDPPWHPHSFLAALFRSSFVDYLHQHPPSTNPPLQPVGVCCWKWRSCVGHLGCLWLRGWPDGRLGLMHLPLDLCTCERQVDGGNAVFGTVCLHRYGLHVFRTGI